LARCRRSRICFYGFFGFFNCSYLDFIFGARNFSIAGAASSRLRRFALSSARLFSRFSVAFCVSLAGAEKVEIKIKLKPATKVFANRF
jgi:hypothetical protein